MSAIHNALVLAGRKPDFEVVIRPELPVLYRVAKRLVRDEDAAADLVQQTLLKALGAYPKFDGRYLRSWLIRILRNENLMRIRSDRTEFVELEEAAAIEASIWDEVLWRSQASDVLSALEQLPTEYKLAVTLCDVEEMSYEEASMAMDVPIGTVRSRLFRGRAMLRARLGGAGGIE